MWCCLKLHYFSMRKGTATMPMQIIDPLRPFLLVFLLSTLIFTGCSDQVHVISEPLVVQPGRNPAGRFNARMIFLADQLERNVDRKSVANTFIVTSFINLNRFSESSGLGRLIAESLIHELQVREWQVCEIRMGKDVAINETGEFVLSRESDQIRNTCKLGGIVTGTYSVAGNDIIINARVMDITSGLVISSAQTHLSVDNFTETLLLNQDTLPEMKIVGGH
jgi:TolB-like protein